MSVTMDLAVKINSINVTIGDKTCTIPVGETDKICVAIQAEAKRQIALEYVTKLLTEGK